MLINKRKVRLPALPSIVWQQAGPPGQTLRARQICPLSALDRLESRADICACPPSQMANLTAQNGWN